MTFVEPREMMQGCASSPRKPPQSAASQSVSHRATPPPPPRSSLLDLSEQCRFCLELCLIVELDWTISQKSFVWQYVVRHISLYSKPAIRERPAFMCFSSQYSPSSFVSIGVEQELWSKIKYHNYSIRCLKDVCQDECLYLFLISIIVP